MTFTRPSPHRHLVFRTAIPVVVAVLGLAASAWVTREMASNEQDRLEQRFEIAAHERADLIISAFAEPLRQLSLLQRVFHSVGDVDWALFERFAEPMIGQVGVRGFAWAPAVDAAERGKFELAGRKLWGKGFVISEMDAAAQLVPAMARQRYYPMLYNLSADYAPRLVGLDLYADDNRRPLIEQAVVEGLPTVGGFAPSLFERQQNDAVVVFVAPVYLGGHVEATRAERRATARGVLLTALDIGAVFDAANFAAPESGLNASLFDAADQTRPAHRWLAKGSKESPSRPGGVLVHTRNLELAGHQWLLRIEPGPDWLEANAAGSLAYIPLIGVLLTLLLLTYVRQLMRQSALAGQQQVSQDDPEQLASEMFASKLAMVVEQNPATIFITDLEGRIEYVNEKFVETTGYSRAEAIGQNVSILNGGTSDESLYRTLWETIAAGNDWQGDLQNRRRDGSLYWERVLIAPIRSRDGTFRNYVAIKENITELRKVMTRLQESESRFRGAVSVMVEGLAIVSPDGTFVFGNQVAEEFMGCAEQGLQGLKPQDIALERLHEDGSPCPYEDYPTTITLREGREVRDAVIGLRAIDGNVRWLQINTSPLRIGEGDACGAVLTFSDITERRRTEEQLKLAFEAIRHSGEGILVTDADQRILSVNPAFEAVTGYSAEEVTGQTPAIVSSVRYDDRFTAVRLGILDRTGHWQGEVWNQRKNGEVYPEWLGISVVREADGRPKYYVYIYSDMSERHEAQQHIEFLAHHDPLTGLPNRLLLRDRLEQSLAQAMRKRRRVALMFLDLDRFKTINDSLGHPVGDVLLKEVVDRLRGCVRESDTISRQGGDEFIILLNDVRDSEAVSRMADKIHQRMGEPVLIGSHSLTTSFSIGIALYPDDGEDFDSLLQKADTAMYHAKEAGRNAHRFFTEQMNRQVVEHMTLQTQLRRALENNEFVLHYQPQMDLHEGGIVGVEALIRWNSPDHGLVSPVRFIPVAEESGLILPIGAWVLTEACRQARAWQDAGLPPFVVAVNLSAVQFKRVDLVNTVINALVLSDLDSQWLELELTESIMIQDAEATLDLVRRLKALGVKMSVDDFGTGYSSLTYLKRFAVDKLKIDQSFVRDLVTDPDDAAIVRAIIQMAHSLKLKTIAEGVESEELANLLRIFRCDEIQGYWLARPMPADQLEAFMRGQRVSGRQPGGQ